MKLASLTLAAVTALTLAAFGADNPEDAKKKEEIRALILADAQSKATQAPKAKAEADPDGAPAPAPDAATKEEKSATAAAAQEPPTMLPQVEVSKSRINEIDLVIAEHDKAIAREKAAAKPTKLDNTLNNPQLTKALSFLGGSSSEDRSAIANERIRLMEEEKDLLEQLKLARTKEEKAELQQEIDDLRAQRRELDGAPK